MLAPLPIIYPLAGGMLIGTAAGLLLLLSGRIAGVSGMLASSLGMAPGGTPARTAVAFVAGLPLGAILVSAFGRTPELLFDASLPLLILGGLVVGFGTRLGSGCTSGHGVCGIARLSPRSLAATATFMALGFVTVFVVRHVVGG